MVETKPFKTKLCLLYQRGRCERQTCTFAHGDGELRRFSDSFPEQRSNRSDDLRSRLGRKRSPDIKYPTERDSRDAHAFRRCSPPPPLKRRKYRTHLDMDCQSDFQRSFKSPEGTSDQSRDKKSLASDSRVTLPDELKKVQHEVNVLLDQKRQLKIDLEERGQEADSLSSRLRDLEAQLSEEKDKFKRVNSNIKMLIKAHVHQSRLQEQIKRSQLEFEQLVDELSIDASQTDASEDYLNVNIISDEEIPESKDRETFRKRPGPSRAEVGQRYKSETTVRGRGVRAEGSVKSPHLQVDGNGNTEFDNKREDTERPSRESKSRRRKDTSKSYGSSQKVLESNLAAPSAPTSMAAPAIDGSAELTEPDENSDEAEIVSPLSPLPCITQKDHLQHEGDDENVNVHDEVDAEC